MFLTFGIVKKGISRIYHLSSVVVADDALTHSDDCIALNSRRKELRLRQITVNHHSKNLDQRLIYQCQNRICVPN